MLYPKSHEKDQKQLNKKNFKQFLQKIYLFLVGSQAGIFWLQLSAPLGKIERQKLSLGLGSESLVEHAFFNCPNPIDKSTYDTFFNPYPRRPR